MFSSVTWLSCFEQKNIPVEKELIINSTPTEVEIALLEDSRLVELHYQKTNANFSVGDVFLGKVRKLGPGLNAAFVDIGHKKDAFLHYSDLGSKIRSVIKYTNAAVAGNLSGPFLDNFQIEPDTQSNGKIDQILTKKDLVLVQMMKEPIASKGPRLTSEITIPGRFLVLTPFSDVIAVSKKIANQEERKRLRTLIESIRPKNFGVIVRTAAEGKKVADLHEELTILSNKWAEMYNQMVRSNPPIKLLSELDKTASILRDLLSDSFNRIVVNDRELYQNLRSYMESFAPDQVNIISHYKGTKPIFEQYNVTRQIKASFGKTTTMNSGAYLVIEHTEAMHVIDVNSGHKMSTSNADDAVLKVNLEAAEEIGRQLRLRDIGGIIIIDFIDMKNPEHKKELLKALRQAMKKDRAQHTILPLSKFGLMQITRQRVRPEVKIDTTEVCPTCNGTGKMNASILIVDDIERDLNFIFQSTPKSKITLTVHPYVEAYLKKGWKSIKVKWWLKHLRWVKIVPKTEYHLAEYRFFTNNDDEIRLNN